jgi:hypothetical protein
LDPGRRTAEIGNWLREAAKDLQLMTSQTGTTLRQNQCAADAPSNGGRHRAASDNLLRQVLYEGSRETGQRGAAGGTASENEHWQPHGRR